jgi:hypothetical protein
VNGGEGTESSLWCRHKAAWIIYNTGTAQEGKYIAVLGRIKWMQFFKAEESYLQFKSMLGTCQLTV